jgi:uncharacterized protein
MKFLYMAGLSILFAITAVAQTQTLDTRKFIEVTGSAVMSLSPDELELEIQLVEYDKSGKKVKLDNVNDEFYRILRKNNIDTGSLVFIRSSDFYWWHWWYNYRNAYYQTRTVTLKLTSATNILKLVEDLNEKWVQNIRIAKSSHSKIYEYRRQVKKEAAKMAKEKAGYLLESMGEELGSVLSVEEVPEVNNNYWWGNSGNLLGNTNYNSQVSSQDDSKAINSVTSIQLRYEIKVKFAIK